MPFHWLRHEHVHPVLVLPVTAVAWLEQFAAAVFGLRARKDVDPKAKFALQPRDIREQRFCLV